MPEKDRGTRELGREGIASDKRRRKKKRREGKQTSVLEELPAGSFPAISRGGGRYFAQFLRGKRKGQGPSNSREGGGKKQKAA